MKRRSVDPGTIFFAKRTNLRLLAWSLAFSAGVMLYVSFVEILPKATDSLALIHSSSAAGWLANPRLLCGHQMLKP